MASVSPTASASPYSLQQFMVQQAKQAADRDEQTAQALKAQANEAQRAADRAQDNARSLAVAANQAETKAGDARYGLAALTSAQQVAVQQSKIGDQLLAGAQTLTTASTTTGTTATTTATTTASTGTSPVVNSQGQVTGTIINTTA